LSVKFTSIGLEDPVCFFLELVQLYHLVAGLSCQPFLEGGGREASLLLGVSDRGP